MQLATAMQPATAFQDELAHLVRAFEPAKALQRRFVELSRAFGNAGKGDFSGGDDASGPRVRQQRERSLGKG